MEKYIRTPSPRAPFDQTLQGEQGTLGTRTQAKGQAALWQGLRALGLCLSLLPWPCPSFPFLASSPTAKLHADSGPQTAHLCHGGVGGEWAVLDFSLLLLLLAGAEQASAAGRGRGDMMACCWQVRGGRRRRASGGSPSGVERTGNCLPSSHIPATTNTSRLRLHRSEVSKPHWTHRSHPILPLHSSSLCVSASSHF